MNSKTTIHRPDYVNQRELGLNPLNTAILIVVIVVVAALAFVGIRRSREGKKREKVKARRLAEEQQSKKE